MKQRIIISIFFIVGFFIYFFRRILLLYAGKYYIYMEIPYILFVGFAIIIIGIFYFFIDIINNKNVNKIVLKFKILDENSIRIIILILMSIAIFIPPISFTSSVMDWKQIGVYNYFRAIIFLIGSAFIPGASIFKILFPFSTLHEKFKVEPFFLKITIYPLLSFTFLGTITLFFDQIGITREFFSYILYLVILILFLCEILIQKYRNVSNFELKFTEIKISKSSFIILFMALGIIIIALGIHLSMKYLIPGDSWKGIAFSYVIGHSEPLSIGSLKLDINHFYSYAIYWGYISFSLSVLSGIPVININALLFPFLFLFITTIYLFIKSILIDFNEKYSILATIFVITFSGIFSFFNSGLIRENLSLIVFSGIFNFRFKSFAFFLTIMASALLVINFRTNTELKSKSILKDENFLIIILGAWFFIQSYIIYLITIILPISIIFLYYFFSNKKKKDFQMILTYLVSLIILFISVDLIASFAFSQITSLYLSAFSSINFFFFDYSFSFFHLLLNAIFIYSILIGVVFLCFLFHKGYMKLFSNDIRIKLNFKMKSKYFFILSLFTFSVLLFISILSNLSSLRRILHIQRIEKNFFIFCLDTLFLNIGFIGILGIYLSYFCFRLKRELFYKLLLWFLILFGMASILIIRDFMIDPFILLYNIPYNNNLAEALFNRIWYYSIIPLSIFSSIGLLKLRIYIKKSIKTKDFLRFFNKDFKGLPNLAITSIIIYLSLTNTIIAGIWWREIDWKISDEEAQIIGWVSENIPCGTNILIDKEGQFRKNLYDASFCYTSYINNEINENSGGSLNTIFIHLKLQNFQYYIYSKKDTYCKKEAENYIDIENELIPLFFNKKVYEYGDLIIYYREIG